MGVEHEQPREQGGHLVTPQHKQEILSSLFRSRGSATATGARTRIDESDISEGITGDESGWTLPDPATAIKAEGMYTSVYLSVQE